MAPLGEMLIGKVVSWPNSDATEFRPHRHVGYGFVIAADNRNLLVRVPAELNGEPSHVCIMPYDDESLRFFDSVGEHEHWLAYWRNDPEPVVKLAPKRDP